MEHLSQQSDEALCDLAAAGDRVAEEQLVSRYSRLVRICARPYFLAGGDSEDLIQEGMIGLLSAIRGFQADRDASFRTYAETCIRNRLRSAVRAASRDKHAPLNHSVSMEDPLFDVQQECLENPEDLLIDREEQKRRMKALKSRLSRFEKTVLDLYLGGLSYHEIAAQVGKPLKSVDNAVQRIRRKVTPFLTSGGISES
jgi:RNA polymerase sporulation-specific sigma factor